MEVGDGGATPPAGLGLLPLLLGVGHKVVLLEPLDAEELGHVVPDRVGEDHDAPLARAQLLGDLEGGPHGGARGATTEEALLANQPAGDLKGVLVVGLDPPVNEGALKHIGDEVVANALHLVGGDGAVEGLGLSEDGAVGVHTNNDAVGGTLLELPGNSGDGSPSSGANDNHVNLAVALLEDLLSGAIVVGKWVVWVAVLVKDD